VMPQVIGHEGRDEVVAVVVARVPPQGERLRGARARRLEHLRPQLLGEKLVVEPLVDQDSAGIGRRGLRRHELARVVGLPYLAIGAEISAAVGIITGIVLAMGRAVGETAVVLYTMGQAGTIPVRFGRIHPKHQTPTVAIAFVQLSSIAAILLVGILLRPEYIFGFLETIATLAVIVLYVMANLALTRYMRREQRGKFTLWQHAVVPWVASLALLPVLFVTVYPEPTWPYNIAPYLFLVALLVGIGYMQWLELRNPGALQKGAMMLTHTSLAPEINLECDKTVTAL